ncbi:type II toxin-antitoxin system HicB family antitoxin [Patescibacteria group bacterium]|nr:type II toxin-antitoxin system HicB family antitoxin [Candidatus Falkowbacteria bacterium]MBU3905787.1 type II toxin-antitoxin system HicB family antitoxin [Patescibacteria group bacterium]MBU4015281.1 type II toxin-antitoxin system HicB family antitoxin [Patescibacteria group bacterium]MBU4026107.1 type II toxin-antitoxin system HicB family antitoxin [Patescibacteria group bacterium]MBU4072884.1 type II toxin-antitoxin system HicB family antitoxin [Patescibacteria group bacterium]
MKQVKQQFTAVYLKRKDWILGWVEEIPGVNTQGKTLEETKENLQEALKLILKTNRELLNKELNKVKVIREPILMVAR